MFVGGGIATVGAAVSAGLAVAALGRRIAPLGTVDVGPRLSLTSLPSRDVMIYSAAIVDLPTYGYRRVHALLRRQAERDGRPPPNAKRVYRVMKLHGLLLQRHSGRGAERRHDGRVAHGTPLTRLFSTVRTSCSDPVW